VKRIKQFCDAKQLLKNNAAHTSQQLHFTKAEYIKYILERRIANIISQE
jgi:hypothetical protein